MLKLNIILTNWYSGAGDWGGVGIGRSITNSSFSSGERGYKPFSLIFLSLVFQMSLTLFDKKSVLNFDHKILYKLIT